MHAVSQVAIFVILFGAATFKIVTVWFEVKENTARKQYQEAREALRRWQTARPFLKVAACPYSRMLVYRMIAAHRLLLNMGASSDFEHLEYLKQLLNQGPSPYDPVTFDSASCGVNLLITKARSLSRRLLLGFCSLHQ